MILGTCAASHPTTGGSYPEDYVEGYGEIPAPAFTASPRSGNDPLAVQFFDTSTGSPTAWLWQFGDGTTSTLRHPTHVYSYGGPYTVTLTVTSDAGSATLVKPEYISVGGFGISDFGTSPFGG